MSLDEFRNIALEGRPDLKEAMQNVELAKITHKLAVANGSTDPTFGLDIASNPLPIWAYIGGQRFDSAAIFDRNQGEKANDADRYRPQ